MTTKFVLCIALFGLAAAESGNQNGDQGQLIGGQRPVPGDLSGQSGVNVQTGQNGQTGVNGQVGVDGQTGQNGQTGVNGQIGVSGQTGQTTGQVNNCTLTAPWCGTGEMCNLCGDRCEQSCGQQTAQCPLSMCTTLNNQGSCQCLPGFARNTAGQCVLAVTCQSSGDNNGSVNNGQGTPRGCGIGAGLCQAGERCNTCGNRCEQICGQANPGCPLGNFCLSANSAGYCECLPGFARNTRGQCVLATTCGNGANNLGRK
ncbi:unnamed protein product, partial [Mesorhabditis spiculigera]